MHAYAHIKLLMNACMNQHPVVNHYKVSKGCRKCLPWHQIEALAMPLLITILIKFLRNV